jgi:hypothetical protein
VEAARFIRSGIAASALGHLFVLAIVLIFAEVHPFGSVTAEPIAVDIVSPDEVTPTPKEDPPKAQPSDAFDLSSNSAPASSPPPAAPQPAAAQPAAAKPAAQPQTQAAPVKPLPDPQQAVAQTPSPATTPSPAYVAPEPDLSLKYHVLLGLPPNLPHGLPQDKPGDGFDAAASEHADIASSLITAFRRHLRTCSKLPPSIESSDKVRIKLRVFMSPEGRIAAEPIVIEGTATLKALDLRQSAIDALQACQPYTMLPADRYGEWKVLDLNFTPGDFTGAS